MACLLLIVPPGTDVVVATPGQALCALPAHTIIVDEEIFAGQSAMEREDRWKWVTEVAYLRLQPNGRLSHLVRRGGTPTGPNYLLEDAHNP